MNRCPYCHDSRLRWACGLATLPAGVFAFFAVGLWVVWVSNSLRSHDGGQLFACAITSPLALSCLALPFALLRAALPGSGARVLAIFKACLEVPSRGSPVRPICSSAYRRLERRKERGSAARKSA